MLAICQRSLARLAVVCLLCSLVWVDARRGTVTDEDYSWAVVRAVPLDWDWLAQGRARPFTAV